MPRPTVQRTRPLMVSPASARTRSCACARPRLRESESRAPDPASATRTFDPPPMTTKGRFSIASQRDDPCDRSARWTLTSQSAGPPTLNVVSGASGASRWTRPEPAAATNADSKILATVCLRSRAQLPFDEARRGLAEGAGGELDPVAGREFPASGRSAVITLAIVGYPPVVCQWP